MCAGVLMCYVDAVMPGWWIVCSNQFTLFPSSVRGISLTHVASNTTLDLAFTPRADTPLPQSLLYELAWSPDQYDATVMTTETGKKDPSVPLLLQVTCVLRDAPVTAPIVLRKHLLVRMGPAVRCVFVVCVPLKDGDVVAAVKSALSH